MSDRPNRVPAGDSPEPALKVAGLCKQYGAREALREVDFQVAPGERLAVVGRNGAGKTTLLSIVAGALTRSSGTIRAAGKVGWVPQHPAVYPKLTVAENLRLFARLEKVAGVEGAVGQMLEHTGLLQRASERVDRLSGGNRQRVNVAIGLLGSPPVVVLDEPTTALDPIQRRRLWELVDGVAADGAALLFSTHIVDEAYAHADRVLLLEEGTTLFLGPPAELVELAGGSGLPRDSDFEAAMVAFLKRHGTLGATTDGALGDLSLGEPSPDDSSTGGQRP